MYWRGVGNCEHCFNLLWISSMVTNSCYLIVSSSVGSLLFKGSPTLMASSMSSEDSWSRASEVFGSFSWFSSSAFWLFRLTSKLIFLSSWLVSFFQTLDCYSISRICCDSSNSVKMCSEKWSWSSISMSYDLSFWNWFIWTINYHKIS